jgi:hypothetical protein
LIVEGVQVPVIPLLEVLGNVGAVLPLQNGAIELKVGRVRLFTVMLIE